LETDLLRHSNLYFKSNISLEYSVSGLPIE